MQEIDKFDAKVSVIPNGLEKYMVFTIKQKFVFYYACNLWILVWMNWLKTWQTMILNIYLNNLVVIC